MKLLILSPLYPPDSDPTARYTKELATRLSEEHSVSILTYGYLPEKIENVYITAVDKRQPLIVCLAQFSSLLFKLDTDVDCIITENGPSVELPLFILSCVRNTPYILHRGDSGALRATRKSLLRRLLHTLVTKRARNVINASPQERPEILPLEPFPTEEIAAFEKSWEKHLAELLRHA